MSETSGLDMAAIMARAEAALAEPADPSAGEPTTSPVTAAPMGGTPADGFPPPVPAGHECETGCGRLFNVVLTWVATSETRILCDICTLVMFMRLAQDIPDLAAPAEAEPAPDPTTTAPDAGTSPDASTGTNVSMSSDASTGASDADGELAELAPPDPPSSSRSEDDTQGSTSTESGSADGSDLF